MVGDLIRLYKKYIRISSYGWSGDYQSWDEAVLQTAGYDSEKILEKVKQSVLKVKHGEAVYERDGVLFDKIEYSWPLLSALLWVAVKKNGSLSVLDYGGSLGSSYFQNRNFLNPLKSVSWNVVEQPKFVKAGKQCIANERLNFFESIDESAALQTPDLLLLSCSLQYMKQPYQLLEQLIQLNVPYIMIDNTPFNFEQRDRITVQKVPPSIYTASYPCWFLDYEKVKASFEKKYALISEHHNDSIIELEGRKLQYKGFFMELKP